MSSLALPLALRHRRTLSKSEKTTKICVVFRNFRREAAKLLVANLIFLVICNCYHGNSDIENRWWQALRTLGVMNSTICNLYNCFATIVQPTTITATD